MKKNNLLLAVLLILVLLYFSSRYFKSNGSTTFNPEIIQLDSSKVEKVTIYPPGETEQEPILISRSEKDWEVTQANIKSKANLTRVRSALGQLQDIKAQRLVAKTKDKWQSYGLTDSLARKLEIQEKGSGGTTTIYFGKTSYEQTAASQYGRASLTGSTYFRINDKPETYALNNQIADAFNHKFNAWRNPKFIKLDKDRITELRFESTDQEDFILRKNDSLWTIPGSQTDSTKVARYLNILRSQNSSLFADTFVPKEEALRTLTVRGASMDELIVRAYADTLGNKYILNSSQHPDVFIESDSAGMFKRLFVDKKYFKADKK
ncbi:DUF4340 domain-containing protein [Maribacter polysiphoniae]|uniref:DUF4340 domain-containing protein n=1 Tax=Maribacter polysiphoniae TaxID=429344 RepID=UPI00235801CB|nr:DUF4340 domain-containing protein [Maribacter polysiphoniae]